MEVSANIVFYFCYNTKGNGVTRSVSFLNLTITATASRMKSAKAADALPHHCFIFKNTFSSNRDSAKCATIPSPNMTIIVSIVKAIAFVR